MSDTPNARSGGQEPPRRQRPSADALQHLSHDIRSAMSDVIGGLRLVDPSRLDAETHTQIDRVRAAADTLAALVDVALMTASGETVIKRGARALELTTWLASLRGRWSGRAAERGSRFTLRAIGNLPKHLQVPPLILERILGNLVGNALIHVPGGDVTVELLADTEMGLTFCVCDDGPGFPSEVLQAMTTGGITRSVGRTGGSGLGLRIARELSAEVGAELTLMNDPVRNGGTAALILPPSVLDWSGADKQAADLPDLSDLRILVAEDNLTNQMILRQMLEKMKGNAVFVGDGVAATEALNRETFDIALVDIEMPRMNGLELMQWVREKGGRLADMPILAITAYVLRDNREAIYAAGADGIIGKPIGSTAEFGRAILRQMGRPVGVPDAKEIVTGRITPGALAIKMDTERLEALLAAAVPPDRAELLLRLVEDLSAVREGLDAGVGSALFGEIRAQTHILIAISGAVGAERLCQLAEVLNIAAKRKRRDKLTEIYAPVRADLVDLLDLIKSHRATSV